MMDFLNSVLECLTGNARVMSTANKHSEKTTILTHTSTKRSSEEIANNILSTLFTSDKVDAYVKKRLNEMVGEYGWTRSIATAILQRMKNAIQQGTAMGPTIKDAFTKATDAAVDFARDHPVYCTIVTLGIRVLLMPWVIEALGFGELGPIEGTFASWWQAR
ncbi:hypothetical protein VTN96DRAFT_7129 [Rasamsonia emersonii]|uniref:Uncharacterized protein n=1 Tax=Rasamsonia emersonii (strain ATCC 16479 / CBS 393.64 / IMI 116815) TaxID=1408163 RepID=A0A0F4Z5H0_RASE3|nr:hypothetical protein T310_0165 [Rasamsonia emersonii CBS 393.64]KKA25779.1 hypothetical protein T310_0165 [Rasamsonia emersonii CBS 393.64]